MHTVSGDGDVVHSPHLATAGLGRCGTAMAAPYDAIVVGSGATGGWAAKELTEAGLSVALLEAGPALPVRRKPAGGN